MSITQYQAVLNNLLSSRAQRYKKQPIRDLLSDLQTNILKSHKKQYAAHIFIEFYKTKEEEIKHWLGNLPLYSALEQLEARHIEKKKEPNILTNLYLSHNAYEYLGYDIRKFPQSGATPFSGTPQSRLAFNTNLEDSTLPIKNKVHAMLLLAGNNIKELEGTIQKLLDAKFKVLDSKGLPSQDKKDKKVIGNVFIQWGNKREVGPFGFVDKSDNPLFFPNPKSLKNILEKDIATLDSVLVKDPNGQNWNSCGSFLVFLKLEQNQEAFEEACQKIEKYTGSQSDLSRALIVGKLPNQTIEADMYLSKNKGCPFRGPHIQVARHGMEQSGRNPIVRRGINYEDSNENQGLLFMSFQSDIGHQFEHLVNQFMINRQGNTVDPLLYNHSAKPTLKFEFPKVNSNDKSRLGFDASFVTLKRGWYLFAPSISAIRELKRKK